MDKRLTSRSFDTDGFWDAMELPFANGWTDGLPVMPPTEQRVAQFLDAAHMEPNEVVAEVVERGRVITAEKLAINAVMAGCLPQYMSVLVATLEALTDPQFKFNHLASLGSPWPIIIVNGPIAREIGLSSGGYLFGPGCRPSASISRAISLVLRNCAEARTEGIQRGQLGNPIRWCGCIAENEDTAWTPLHVQRGFDRDSSAVTVVSTYPGSPCHSGMLLLGERPERMLDPVCHTIAGSGGANWIRGTYVLLIGPHIAEIFVKRGWSKGDVRRYIFENARASIAELKYRGAWGGARLDLTEEMHRIEQGDESRYLYLFKDNGEDDRQVFWRGCVEDRVIDLFVVVAGGNAGHRVGITVPYQQSTNPVTRAVRPRH